LFISTNFSKNLDKIRQKLVLIRQKMSRIRKNQDRPSRHSDFLCTQALYYASTQRARRPPHQQTAWPGRQAPGFANSDRVGASPSSAAWSWQAPVAASGRLEAHNQNESDLVSFLHRESFIVDFRTSTSRSRYRS
jgi:hypothetical protein